MSIKSLVNEGDFHHYFQPIYELGGCKVLGYEVLLRSTVYSNPALVFQEAREEGVLYELDSRSIHKALSTYQAAGFSSKDGKIFINVFPSTIVNPDFLSFLNLINRECELESQQVVLEVSESEIIEDFDLFKSRIAELKRLGFSIAIDDIGKGYANFEAIIELRPDYLKLDRYFAHNLDGSPKKQTVISLFHHYCEQHQSQLILEGLEMEKEVTTAKSLGLSIGQGYVLGKPAPLKKKFSHAVV